MDVDYFNSPDPDHNQMDLMTLMMQMEKLQDESSPPTQPYFHFPIFNGSSSSSYSSPRSSSSTSSSYYTNNSNFAAATAAAPPFPQPALPAGSSAELSFEEPLQSQRQASVAAMREMIFRIAAMQPVHIDPESVKPPKRRNVRISTDPQSVSARHRRERISERIRILQRLVPGGTKMDTASMLDEAIHYMKFLKSQVQSLERAAAASSQSMGGAVGFAPMAVMELSGRNLNYNPALQVKGYETSSDQEHHQEFNMK